MTATNTPRTFNAGDSVSWVASVPEYLPRDGWSLGYSLLNASEVYTLTSSPLGADFEVSVTATESRGFAPGEYTLVGFVTRGDERLQVSSSRLTIKPDITTAHDRRSQAERTLQAIRDVLEGKASDDQQMIQYAGRTLSRYTFEQLITIESKLARTVAREKARRAGHPGRIGVRFR